MYDARLFSALPPILDVLCLANISNKLGAEATNTLMVGAAYATISDDTLNCALRTFPVIDA